MNNTLYVIIPCYNEEKNKLFMRCKMDFISESIEEIGRENN